MANTYTWSFPALEVYTQHCELCDVVYMIHWRYKATEGAPPSGSSPIELDVFGVESIPFVSGSQFTPFEELTQEIVEGWVVARMGEERVTSMQQQLDSEINKKRTPTQRSVTPPWMISPTPSTTPTSTPTPTPTATPVEPTPTPTETLLELTPTPTETVLELTPTPTPTPVV